MFIDAFMSKHPYIPGMNPTWSEWADYYAVLLYSILVRILHLCASGMLICSSYFWFCNLDDLAS